MNLKAVCSVFLSSFLLFSSFSSVTHAEEPTKSNLENHYFEVDNKVFQPQLPLKGTVKISSNFGWLNIPFAGIKRFHKGTDFVAKEGTPVYSIEDGVVSYAGNMKDYGNVIIINHQNGYASLYAHLQDKSLVVKEGDVVKQGEMIAKVGSTGATTGPHLHLSILKKSNESFNFVNPLTYLK